MKDIEKRAGEFVKTRGDGAAGFEMADHKLDELDAVAFDVEAPVPTDRRGSVRARRDHRKDTFGDQGVAGRIGIIVVVREEMAGSSVGQRHHALERRAFRRFAGL